MAVFTKIVIMRVFVEELLAFKQLDKITVKILQTNVVSPVTFYYHYPGYLPGFSSIYRLFP